ncbi:MAG: FAD-dependent oxidoreductase [Gammaproteobacteria bacterium]|nr:FAD-dependent oxidoreductase [Gammaproteobacteria bacterium]
MTGVVIVGGGQAAGQLAINLRNRGYAGPVTLLCAEPHLPYQRPPLSKGLLTGETDAARARLRDAEYYAEEKIDCRTGTRATGIDTAARELRLADGSTLGYAQLVLATGASPRTLPLPGAELDGVLSLRTLDDALALRARLATGSRLAIIGGGFIGMEVAASARKLGCQVDVIERESRVLARVLSRPMAAALADRHETAGVRIHTGATVAALEGEDRLRAVRLGSGDAIEADTVLIAIGVTPNTDLAGQAGLTVKDGIVVDSACRTSAADIFAIGDCCRFPHPQYGSLRLESVANAMGQARTLAGVIFDGRGEYADLPSFWTDQYELRLQMGGVAGPEDEAVVRGTPGEAGFAVLYLANGGLRAAEVLNDSKGFLATRRILSGQAQASEQQLRDQSVPLAELAAMQRRTDK